MPYHSKQETLAIFGANISSEFLNSNGTRYASSNRRVYSSTVAPIYASMRDGTNSSIPELIRLYGIGAFTLTKKKKFVGYEFKTVVKRIWYRDRAGNSRLKVVEKPKRFPKFITVTQARFNKSALTTVKDSTFYLKPNRLTFSQATNVVSPGALLAVTEVWSGSLGGYVSQRHVFTCEGPGLFVNPYFQAPPYQVGNPDLGYMDSYSGNGFLNNEALRRLYSKAASDIPDYMTAAAESRELFRTLRSIALTGLKLIKDLKRLDIRRLKGRLKTSPQDISSLWLTWIYGVAPVISDITDTIDVVKRSDRTWRSFTTAASSVVVSNSGSQPVTFVGTERTTTTTIERWGVILEGRISVESVLRDQVNWQGVASTTYELVPFSFMLDWVVNIGEYLGSSQIFEDKVYSAWQTSLIKKEFEAKGQHQLVSDYPYNRTQTAPFTINQTSMFVRRVPIDLLPDMPDIKVKKPATDVLNLSRAINAVAILVATTGGLKRPPGMR